jgi:Alginate export
VIDIILTKPIIKTTQTMTKSLLLITGLLPVCLYAIASDDFNYSPHPDLHVTIPQADTITLPGPAMPPENKLKLDFEYRSRAEYRNGYQQLRNDTTVGAFFINQRSRLTASYSMNNRLQLLFSIQDLRVWGQQDPKSTSGTVQVYEAWVEPYVTDKFSVRIGRQKLVYDDQRLFGDFNWRLSGYVHDAVNFRYYSSKVQSETVFAFNQSSERYFGTDYSTSGFTDYKFLAVNYIHYSLDKYFTLTGINSADGYQSKTSPEKLNVRYTLGGRIEAESGNTYATFSGYYQTGTNPAGQPLSAWYLQPEVRYSTGAGLTARLGAEILSGNSMGTVSSTDHSFVPLYGSPHPFNGTMDLFIKFPGDVHNAGLVDPYLFVIQTLVKKFQVRADFHAFYLQSDYVSNNKLIGSYLGFENDWLFSWNPNPVTRIDLGMSYMLPTNSLQIVKGSGNSKYDLTWSYLSFTFKPVLFKTSFK